MRTGVIHQGDDPVWAVPRGSAGRNQRRRREGFTLLEVILAISIAIGILVVALAFYQQAADLRGQLLREAERLSDIRLLLDRVTADLRTACSGASSFQGDTTSLSFLKTGLGFGNSWTSSPAGDLKRVEYRAATRLDGTNLVVTGITRTEEPLSRMAAKLESRSVTPAPGESGPATNIVGNLTTNQLVNPHLDPLSEAIRFLRFRYWDGEAWADAWYSVDPPTGVEVTVGSEPLPEEALSAEYPSETFRRVIFLPGGRQPEAIASPATP